MLNCILNATMSFFNSHSSGRILNRFSKDVGCMDELIPYTLNDTLRNIVNLVTVTLLVSFLNYWLIIPALLLFLFIYLFGMVFQHTNKNMKRTEGTSRSPIFSHLTATLQGLTTIRAFNVHKILRKEFDEHQNLHVSASYLSLAFYFALGFWVDIVCLLYLTLVTFSFFLWDPDVASSYIGLTMCQTLIFLGQIQYAVKRWSELDNQMTSVERVKDYSDLLPEEDSHLPIENWPNQGSIIFKSVSLRYSPEAPFVLKDINFHIFDGEKVGVVGRTGAGKSSLTSALFRLFPYEGAIIVDGVDCTSLPLHTLRSKLTLIPQDPVFFLGTLRQNLDPFNEFNDLQLWAALEEVGMKGAVSGLDGAVSEGGANFSVGQRQLLCLARALLRDSRILVLDEATANLDLASDEMIQAVLRRRFKGCTVMIIAHRLNTVMEADRVLLMDAGRVVMFDEPKTVFESSWFHEFLIGKEGKGL